ncbi:MAG: BMP family ABC transporter substrate-binding protein [Acidimicrobiales bacterium]|nr:BMP family ABC transporter substrate-binding protein [Acidimicrobiales bacterium]
MKRRLLLVLTILLSFSLIAAACGDDDDTGSGDDSSGDDSSGDDSSGDDGTGDDGTGDDGTAGGASDVTAAFVYIGEPGDAGWTWAHDQGRQFAEDQTGATTVTVENIGEGSPEFDQAVRDFIADGADVIFATSFGYMDAMETLAAEFPDVVFDHATGFKSNGENFGNYFGRIYQARYLTGLTAGAASESGNVGYVAAFPIPEVIRGINAFTLGVREANPDATVTVNWTFTWFDPAVEGDAANALLEGGADVIAMHQDSTAAGEAAEAAGARWVSYNSDMSAFAPDAYLSSAVWDWGPYYASVIEQVAAGTYEGGAYWGGMDDGIVQLGSLADDVSDETKAQIDDLSQQMIDGTWDPFTGPINDQDGNEVIADGVVPDDGALLGMDYFVEGVIGSANP